MWDSGSSIRVMWAQMLLHRPCTQQLKGRWLQQSIMESFASTATPGRMTGMVKANGSGRGQRRMNIDVALSSSMRTSSGSA